MQLPSFSGWCSQQSQGHTVYLYPTNYSSSPKQKARRTMTFNQCSWDTWDGTASPWPWGAECISMQTTVERVGGILLWGAEQVATVRGDPGLAPPRIHLLPCPRKRQVVHLWCFCLRKRHHRCQRPLGSAGMGHTLRRSSLVGSRSCCGQGFHRCLGGWY